MSHSQCTRSEIKYCKNEKYGLLHNSLPKPSPFIQLSLFLFSIPILSDKLSNGDGDQLSKLHKGPKKSSYFREDQMNSLESKRKMKCFEYLGGVRILESRCHSDYSTDRKRRRENTEITDKSAIYYRDESGQERKSRNSTEKWRKSTIIL